MRIFTTSVLAVASFFVLAGGAYAQQTETNQQRSAPSAAKCDVQKDMLYVLTNDSCWSYPKILAQASAEKADTCKALDAAGALERGLVRTAILSRSSLSDDLSQVVSLAEAIIYLDRAHKRLRTEFCPESEEELRTPPVPM